MMKRLALLLIPALIGLCSFLSCTIQSTPSLLSAQTSEKDNATKVLEGTPFAFDFAIDTISYNSCVGDNLNANGYIHGFKMGANEGFVDSNGTGAVKSGLKLRSEFLQYMAKNIPPNFPETVISVGQIQYLLQNAPSNENLMIQYAVRKKEDLTVVPDIIVPAANQVISVGRDGDYELSSLNSDPVLSAITNGVKFAAQTVLSEGPRVYNVGTKSNPKALEKSFGYTNSTDISFPVVVGQDDSVGAGEDYADRVRTQFNLGKYILALTYGNRNSEEAGAGGASPSSGLNTPKRKVEKDLTKAYGRGFELSFNSKNPSFSSWRKNILFRVNEKVLETGASAPGVSWVCDNFVIMKPNQWNNKKAHEPSCAQLNGADLDDDNVAKKVKILRRHYSEAQWGIGFYYAKDAVYNSATRTSQPMCIVSKATDCYLPTVGLDPAVDVGVQYDTTQECYLSRAVQMGVVYSGGLTQDAARSLGRCPQYASICIRNSTSY